MWLLNYAIANDLDLPSRSYQLFYFYCRSWPKGRLYDDERDLSAIAKFIVSLVTSINVTFCFQWRRHSEYVGYQNGEHIEYIFKHFILYNWLYKMKSIDVLGSKHSWSVPKITEISGSVLCLWAYREWKWSPFRATWAHWSALILVRVVLSHAPANTASRTPANTARPRIRR